MSYQKRWFIFPALFIFVLGFGFGGLFESEANLETVSKVVYESMVQQRDLAAARVAELEPVGIAEEARLLRAFQQNAPKFPYNICRLGYHHKESWYLKCDFPKDTDNEDLYVSGFSTVMGALRAFDGIAANQRK